MCLMAFLDQCKHNNMGCVTYFVSLNSCLQGCNFVVANLNLFMLDLISLALAQILSIFPLIALRTVLALKPQADLLRECLTQQFHPLCTTILLFT